MALFDLAPVPVPDLSDRTVLVTGASRGIGAELVRMLVTRGARVFAGLHGEPPAEAHQGAITLPLDVTSQGEVDGALARVEAEAGRLDVLVNNAGVIAPILSVAELDPAALARACDVNLVGVQRVTRAALPLLSAARGTIINAGTGAATKPMEGWAAYCATKAAMLMLTRMYAVELADQGIRSYFIGISPTDTEMQVEIRASGKNAISRIPRDDLASPAVPASVMAWLCSEQARAIDVVELDVRQERFRAMMRSAAEEATSIR